jgi:hypothetical protein
VTGEKDETFSVRREGDGAVYADGIEKRVLVILFLYF